MSDTISQILALKDSSSIEQAVKKLSWESLQELFKQLNKAPSHWQEIVPPFLAGISLLFFVDLLQKNPEFFKNHIHHEILHHKIALLGARIEEERTSFKKRLENLEGQIQNLSITPVQYLQLTPLRNDLNSLLHEIKHDLDLLNILLELAWLSERADLVEILHPLKELLVHLRIYHTSLVEQLRIRLNSSYALQNQASALDALASLGFLYVNQWRKLLSLLSVDTDGRTEKELLQLIDQKLQNAHLKTVEDFKKNEIYTEEDLLHHLAQVLP